MAFTRRNVFEKAPTPCSQCGKEPAILTRADKRGQNCAKFIDEAKADREKHAADVKKLTGEP